MLRHFRPIATSLVSGAAIMVALTGCGGMPAHLALRRRREPSLSGHGTGQTSAADPVASAALPPGARLAQALSMRGEATAVSRLGYALECGVYPGYGYLATIDLSLPGRSAPFTIQLPMYNGPGRYRVASPNGLATAVAAVRMGGFGSAMAGWVAVSPGGRAGTVSLTFGPAGSSRHGGAEAVSGAWACAPPGAGYRPAQPTSATTFYQNLTVSGALDGHVGAAEVPSQALLAGAPNCGVYQSPAGSHFNMAMVVVLEGHHYIVDVQLQQYQGAGQYYPAFTTASLPIETLWATGEVVRDGSFATPGQIPSSIWAAVGGDFRLDPGIDSGLMAIRFMNRTGSSFVITGEWSC
jgi:hypothetical protein